MIAAAAAWDISKTEGKVIFTAKAYVMTPNKVVEDLVSSLWSEILHVFFWINTLKIILWFGSL